MNPMLLSAVLAMGATPSTDDVRGAIARGLPYLEQEGVAWIAERKCLSCHVVSFLLWSRNEAKAKGIEVDGRKLDEWTAWSMEYSMTARQWHRLPAATLKPLRDDGVPEAVLGKLKPVLDRAFPTIDPLLEPLSADERVAHSPALLKRSTLPRTAEKNDGGSIATMGQLLLGRTGNRHASVEGFVASAPHTLRMWQEADGSWKGTGQLFRQNRSAPETTAVTTGWTVLGLGSMDKLDPAAQQSLDKALAYFRKSKQGRSLEQLLVRLLVEHRFGSPEAVAALLKETLGKQNPDGGWAWAMGGPSDAYATGQALYALGVAGGGTEAIVKARGYLLTTQEKDGSWTVAPKLISDPKSTDTRVEKIVPIYRYWGTAWAVIGLSRTLP